MKKKLLCQYVTFASKLATSVSREVRIMSAVFSSDIQSVTGKNLANIAQLFNLNPRREHVGAFKEIKVGHQTPASDEWRLPLLRKLLSQRREFSDCDDDATTIDELIDSLCTS